MSYRTCPIACYVGHAAERYRTSRDDIKRRIEHGQLPKPLHRDGSNRLHWYVEELDRFDREHPQSDPDAQPATATSAERELVKIMRADRRVIRQRAGTQATVTARRPAT